MKKSLLIISLLLGHFLSFAQIDYTRGIWDVFENEEYNYIPSSGILDSRNGHRLSPHGEIRFLLAFVELEYSNPENDPSPTGTEEWPVGQLPVWKDDLLEIHAPSGLSNKHLTKYFQMASSNSHVVLGDYLVAPDNGGVFKISTIDGRVDNNNLINSINQKLGNAFTTAHGFSSIADFDFWTVTHDGETKPNIGNNKWDFVVFIIRNSKNPSNCTGYSSPYNSPQLLGYQAEACSRICTYGNNPTQIIRHEYAHQILGGNNFHSGGGGFGGNNGNYWIPQTGGWGLLGLYGCSLWTWSAWDRYRLGWTGIGNQFEISARDQNGIMEVSGDLDATNPNHAGIYTLRDFATTGDALRIKLPFVDEDTEYPEWIWVENHQGFANNGCEFDRWQYDNGQQSCIEGMTPGMMLYIQINNERRVANESDLLFKHGFHADYTRPMLANGHWDLQFPPNYVINGCISYDTVRPFIRFLGNPLTGANDQENYTYDKDDNNLINTKDQLPIWIEQTTDGVLHRHLYSLGHSSHVFTMQGNHKIGMGTNPSTATQINMVGEDYPYSAAKNLRITYLNGVSIEMIEQCPNGDIRVKIRFDDVDIDNDTRWCSDTIVLNSIETSSGYSLNVNKGKTILLDQGLTATRMRNPISYQGQKVFASPTRFIVKPDVRIHLDTAASIVLDNSSKLCFRERSSCVIEDRGMLVVKRGTVLQLDDCASLVINGTGKLIVEEGAELRISPMAILAFQDGMQNLVMESGVIIYHVFANPNTLIANTISNAVITSSTTWSGLDCKVNGRIVVENGATLSIESSLLSFNDHDGRIVVKQGGKLIIDSSMLKSAHSCSDMWSGIEVWGDATAHQFEEGGRYAQGYVELRNGAVIENAECAVSLWRPGHWNATGGIVRATGATFRNCTQSVQARHYTNHHPATGGEAPYNAHFRDCTFTIDQGYLGTETFYRHVDLSHVNGVRFEGCDFIVDRSVAGVSHHCSGIGAYTSGFHAVAFCDQQGPQFLDPCPEHLTRGCTFTGFHCGIHATNDGSAARSFIVSKAGFENNTMGIYALNTGFATILGCDFTVGCGSDCDYGIQRHQGTSSSPSGNTFGGSLYHFYNDGDCQLTCYHSDTASGQAPAAALLHRVTPVTTASFNPCLSHYSGGPVRSAEEKADIEAGYLAARDAYTSLMQLYGLQGRELDEHEDYMRLLGFHRTLHVSGRNTHMMTEAEAAMVEGMAATSTGVAKAMAEAIMERLEEGRVALRGCPEQPYGTGGGRGHATPASVHQTALSDGFKVVVSPNPARTWAVVDYELPAGAASATMTLANTLGVAVLTAHLDGSRGQKVIDLSALPSGVYILRVAMADGKVFTDKVVKE